MEKVKIINQMVMLDFRIVPNQDKRFVIVPSLESMGQLVMWANNINSSKDLEEYTGGDRDKALSFYKNIVEYGSLRLGENKMPPMDDKPPYLVPSGLIDFEELLEDAEIEEWGFDDEYSVCSHCGELIRTIADGYNWTPEFWNSPEGRLCIDCVNDNEDFTATYLEAMENKLKGCNLIDLEEQGYVPLDIDFTVGLYEWAKDDPRKVLNVLNTNEISVYFKTYPNQFSVTYDVYVKTKHKEKAEEIIQNVSVKYDEGTSPVEVMKAQLQRSVRS